MFFTPTTNTPIPGAVFRILHEIFDSTKAPEVVFKVIPLKDKKNNSYNYKVVAKMSLPLSQSSKPGLKVEFLLVDIGYGPLPRKGHILDIYTDRYSIKNIRILLGKNRKRDVARIMALKGKMYAKTKFYPVPGDADEQKL